MRRSQFEHVIAAAANVVGEDEFVVIGSQAIFGAVEDPPDEMLRSMEADLYPSRAPEKAEDVEGAMGDGSPFQRQFADVLGSCIGGRKSRSMSDLSVH